MDTREVRNFIMGLPDEFIEYASIIRAVILNPNRY
jgi:hypothetical protein